MRRLTVISFLVAAACIAISVYAFADDYPRRGALWVALAVVSLFGAWLSIGAARHGVNPRSHTESSR